MSGAGEVAYKVIGIGSGLLAAKVARKALDVGWARTRGGEPPRNPAIPGQTWSEALTWAIASGIGIGLSQLLVNRFAAGQWTRVMGTPTPSFNKTTLRI